VYGIKAKSKSLDHREHRGHKDLFFPLLEGVGGGIISLDLSA